MKERLILLIDTALKGVSLRLGKLEGDSFETVSSQFFFTNQIAAARLPGIVESALSIHDYELSSLETLAVSKGPGSFTGIKVGLSFVNALSAGLPDLRVVGLSSLECLARHHKESVWFLPATKSQGYLGAWYENEARLFVVDIKEGNLSIASEGSRDSIPLDIVDGKTIEVLLPWEMLRGALDSLAKEGLFHTVEKSAQLVQDAMISELVSTGGEGSKELSPRYVRKSAPEELKEKKKG